MRHAKAMGDGSAASDLLRALTPAGHEGARAIGRVLARQFIPSKILGSPALRVRETLAEIVAAYQEKGVALPDIDWHDAIYSGGMTALLSLLAEQAETLDCVFLAGHNPDLHALAGLLAQDGDEQDLMNLAMRFAPGTACVLQARVPWHRAGQSSWHLVQLLTPETLLGV